MQERSQYLRENSAQLAFHETYPNRRHPGEGRNPIVSRNTKLLELALTNEIGHRPLSTKIAVRQTLVMHWSLRRKTRIFCEKSPKKRSFCAAGIEGKDEPRPSIQTVSTRLMAIHSKFSFKKYGYVYGYVIADVIAQPGANRGTIKLHVGKLVAAGLLVQNGVGRGTCYSIS